MKHKKSILLLLSANAISGFAQGISMVAIPWTLINLMDKQVGYNNLFGFVTLLTIFWSPYAGTLIDRYPKKNIFLTLTALGAIILGSVSFFGFTASYIPIELIWLVFGFTVLNFNIHYPALYAFSQELTERNNFGKVNSMLEIQGQATNMLAGGIAAVLLSGVSKATITNYNLPTWFYFKAWSLQHVFLLDAITYIIAFILILCIKYKPSFNTDIDKNGIVKRLKNGFVFLKLNPHIFLFGSLSYVVFVVLIVHAFYLLPIYISNYLNKDAFTLGIAEVCYTAGALSAGLWIRKLFKRMNPLKGIISLMFLTVSILLALALFKSVIVLFVVCLFFGLANSGVRILRITWLFEHVPNKTIGRVNSVFQMLNVATRLLLIKLFVLSFYTQKITRSYFTEAMLTLVCIIPLLLFYKIITSRKIIMPN